MPLPQMPGAPPPPPPQAPAAATPPQVRSFTATDPKSGQVVHFDWHEAHEPTDQDLADIFAEAAHRRAAMVTPPPVPKSTFEKIEDAVPWVGGAIGSVLGGIPGAALGAAAGRGLVNTERALTVGLPPVNTSGPPPSPTEAGVKEALGSATEMGSDAITKGVIPEVIGRGVSKVISGPMRPAAGSLDARVAQANKELDLRLGAHEITPDTVAGMTMKNAEEYAKYSFSGRVIDAIKKKVGTKNALQGAADGRVAYDRVGKALDQIVNAGPDYDMLPHKIEATRIFNEEIAPKILDQHAQVLSPQLKLQLQQAASGNALSPDLTVKLIKAVRKVVTQGNASISTGSLDQLERILQAKDTVKFGSATSMRTQLIEDGTKGDALLGKRNSALARKFTGDLTEGLSTAYQTHQASQVPQNYGPGWDEYRTLYGEGTKAQEEGTAVKDLLTENPAAKKAANPSDIATATTKAQATPNTYANNAEAIENLTLINEAMRRRSNESLMTGAGMRKILHAAYNTTELLGISYGAASHGTSGALTATMFFEGLPAMITWAARSPTMTKLLTEGLTTADTSKAVANLGRVFGAWYATTGQSKRDPRPAIQETTTTGQRGLGPGPNTGQPTRGGRAGGPPPVPPTIR